MRREVALVTIVAGVALGLHVWAAAYNLDPIDEAYFVDLAHRVFRGELPYRDFDTYYTPGVFYLLAGVYQVAGVSVVPVRVLLALVRVACGLLLFRLGRRLVPWPFAVLPIVALAAVDPIPLVFDPHPGWLALLALLGALELGCAWITSGRRRWILAAGAAVGVAFLFKQNVGAFAGLALASLILLRPHDPRPAGWLVRVAQLAWVLALLILARVFLRASWASLVGVVLWWPLAGALVVCVWVAWRRGPPASWWAGVRPVVLDGLAVALGAFVVTVLWLGPLVVALGPAATPFGLFVGQVNQGALGEALAAPPGAAQGLGLLAIWLPVGLSLVLWPRSRRASVWLVLFAAIVASMVVLLVPAEPPPLPPLLHFPIANQLDAAFGTLFLFLAPASAWAAVLTLVALCAARRSPPSIAMWLVLAGVLAALAFYPRFDVPHAALAGAPLLVVGAWALWRVHAQLAVGPGWTRRAILFAALVPVLAAACAPHLYWRYIGTAYGNLDAAEPAAFVPLELARAPVLAPAATAAAYRGTVDYLQTQTAPGEPVFAYPVDSLVNFLADRPNPTRFTHLMAGALTPDDEAEVIASLERVQPRIVVVDDGAVAIWGTTAAYPRLTDYLARCYRSAVVFAPLQVKERQPC